MHRLGIMTLASAGAAFLLLVSIPNAGAKPAGKGGGGGGSTCSPSPVVVIIDDSYVDPTTSDSFTSAIASDGLGEYRDGVDGVGAVIHDCPNGTGDLTLGTSSGPHKKAQRSIILNFTDTVYSDSLTPDWLSVPLAISGININKLTNNKLSSDTFTTGGGGGGFPNPNYYLRFANPHTETITNPTPNANSPCDTAKINVIHTAATNLTAEKWEVWSDASTASTCSGVFTNPIQIGAVVDSRTNWSSVGQARLPFHLTVQKITPPQP